MPHHRPAKHAPTATRGTHRNPLQALAFSVSATAVEPSAAATVVADNQGGA
jgi:hypothetical protein